MIYIDVLPRVIEKLRVDLITDAHANVVDKRSFDAWGKMRDLPWEAQASLDDPLYLTQLPFTNKAFTGHENIQEVGLIHMNGRVYDPVLARFMSADVFIQSPWSSQSFNRYGYVWNGPMKYTDPSGWVLRTSDGSPVRSSNGNSVGTGNDISHRGGGNNSYSEGYRKAQSQIRAPRLNGKTHNGSGQDVGKDFKDGKPVISKTSKFEVVQDLAYLSGGKMSYVDPYEYSPPHVFNAGLFGLIAGGGGRYLIRQNSQCYFKDKSGCYEYTKKRSTIFNIRF